MTGYISNAPRVVESGVDGAGPAEWFGSADPDGDAGAWITAPLGSHYFQKPASGDGTTRRWLKLKNDGRDDDWCIGMGVICERVAVADFTDGGSTAGTYTMNQSIPVGAYVLRAIVENCTGFTGDTTATLKIGDGTDDDRYNATTVNVFADAVALDGGVPSGTAVHVAAKTPVLTVTTGADFTACKTDGKGVATVKIFYLK